MRPTRGLSSLLRFTLLPVVAFTPACGAGDAVRPDDPSAASALGDKPLEGAGGGGGKGCTIVPAVVEPLVVDWRSSEQVDLSVAMKGGVALVSYDCKSIQLVKNCKANGGYAFTAVPSLIEEAVKIQDAEEARASLPFSGAKLGGGLATGSSIDIALAYVGKSSTQGEAFGQAQLSGPDCSKATHFVRRATIGAYTMATGTRGEVRAAADIFAVSAAASSSSSKGRLSSAGDVGACKAIKDSDEKPPSGCAAILRLELQALSDRAPNVDSKAPIANTCPDGFLVGAGGSCVKRDGPGSFVCDMTDPQECKDQCKKGSAGSCFNAGTIAEGHEPSPVTRALYKKACEGNLANACYRWGKLSEGEDWPSAEAGLRKGCTLGSAPACKLLAHDVHNSPMKTTFADEAAFNKRACELGDWQGCQDAAELYLNGPTHDSGDTLPRQPQKAVEMLVPWCESGRQEACGQLWSLYGEGKLMWGWNRKEADFPKDAAKAASYKTKYCAAKGHSADRCK